VSASRKAKIFRRALGRVLFFSARRSAIIFDEHGADQNFTMRTRRLNRINGDERLEQDFHQGNVAESEGRILSWAEVNRTHRRQNGVYQRNGRLVSLLTDFGRINPCYPDEQDETGETISYTGEGRRGDQHLSPGNRALLAAIETGHAVPLFNKLSTGRWQHMGYWRVARGAHRFDEKEDRMLWQFTLKKVTGDG